MITGHIVRQRLNLCDSHVVADTIDYLEAKFLFKTDDWAELEKWAHFADSGGTVYDIRLTDDCIRKKDHLNLSAGMWKVCLHGNEFRGGEVVRRITTDEAALYVSPTGTLDGEPFPAIPASVTEQILARLENVEQNGGGTGGGITTETDPTVPDWAKQPEKPTYTAEEVGALPADTKIPKKTSDLQNDSGFVADSMVYAKDETYSQTEIDRLISALEKRLNAVADSDDVTLDQLSEIVAYIKSNKTLIDSITTNKVSVSDIVDNLTTGDSTKPLSAAQGKALKALYDALPAWAKESVKPTYTKAEVGLGNVDNVKQYSASNPPPYPVTSVNGENGAVKLDAEKIGALPASTKIPAKTSDITNDSGYITIAVATLLNYYLKTEVYAKTETYSQTEVDNLISGLDKRLAAIADSDDETLDQLSEIVAYIKSNKSLIDSITTTKVNVSDIVNNLTTADEKKPLSAAQGKELKTLYDSLPSWAKASSKPSYNKSEVGLGNVANERQYSASNPPPYPVKSVNGKTGAVQLEPADMNMEPVTVTGVDADGKTHTWILAGWGDNPI